MTIEVVRLMAWHPKLVTFGSGKWHFWRSQQLIFQGPILHENHDYGRKNSFKGQPFEKFHEYGHDNDTFFRFGACNLQFKSNPKASMSEKTYKTQVSLLAKESSFSWWQKHKFFETSV